MTTADLVVVSLLLERPMHGYDLLGEYARQEVVDWASISKAQLYYALHKLAGLGMIEMVAEEEGAARDRRVYRPTPEAVVALEEALANTRWAATRIAQPFTTWLGLSVHASPEAQLEVLLARIAFLSDEIEKEKASLAYIVTLDDDRAKRGSEIVGLMIRQMEVELDWALELSRKRRG